MLGDGKLWWLEEDMDEVMPEGKTNPSEFILGIADRGYLIGRKDEDGEKGYSSAVREGDTVALHYREDLGEVQAVFNTDGTYTATGKIPTGYSHCWIPGDPDTLAGDIDELAKILSGEAEMFEGVYFNLPPGEAVTVEFYFWSDKIHHRLMVLPEGARLVPIPTITTKPN